MTLPVYIDPELSEVQPGATVQLAGSEGRHAVTVRRTKVGEAIDVVNGRGVRATITVTQLGKNELVGTVERCVVEEPHIPRITLTQALAKGGRDEQAVETATEYGVDRVIPWQAERSIVSWSQAAKAEKGRARWVATAEAATKQSRRSWSVEVEPVHTTKQLVAYIEKFVADGGQAFVCHESATAALRAQLTGEEQDILIVVGPEGGITDREVAEFSQVGAHVVVLGEHVLRSASAGPWAIAVIRATA